MSNTRCEAVHWMTPIFVISLVVSFVLPILERPLIYLLCIVTTLAHWHYGTKVVSWTISFSVALHSQLTHELFFFFIDLCRFSRCAFISIDNVSKWPRRRQQNPIECTSFEIRTNFRLLLVFYSSFLKQRWSLIVKTNRWIFHLENYQQNQTSGVDIFETKLFLNWNQICWRLYVYFEHLMLLIMSNFIKKIWNSGLLLKFQSW